MISTIKSLLGFGPKANYKELIQNGAQIIDVRSRGEYALGHIKGSLNIPLNELSTQLKKLKKDKPIITCCASGMRSASARAQLKALGFTEVHNGGGWYSLNNKI